MDIPGAAVTATQMASQAVVDTVLPQTVIRAEEATVEEAVLVALGTKCLS